MKRITSLICTALILIIGGVYAAWTYSTTKFTAVDVELATMLQADVAGNSTIGEFNVVNTVSISITDDKKDTGSGLVDGNDYKAEISWSGSLVYTFVPNTLGQQNSDHIIYGVPLEMYLIIPTAQYNSLQIFTFDGDESATYKHFISPVFTAEDISNSTTTKSASNEDEIGTIEKIVNGEDVAFTWTITAEEIGELINFYNNNLKLPTRQDYVNFSSILTNANFDVRAGYKGEVLLPDGI